MTNMLRGQKVGTERQNQKNKGIKRKIKRNIIKANKLPKSWLQKQVAVCRAVAGASQPYALLL
jgi:hypothetical protein